MKKKETYLTLFVILIFLINCGGEKKTKIETTNVSNVLKNDTIIETYGDILTIHSDFFQTKDTFLILDNEQYQLTYTTQLDTTKPFSFIEIYTKNEIHKMIHQGYNVIITISLKNKLGETIFDTQITKDNFTQTLDNAILARSISNLPNFLGYLQPFDAFAFTIDFLVYDSDVGQQCFLLFNKKGELIENSFTHYFGCGDCASNVQIPNHQKFIVTCQKILNENHQTITFNKDCPIATILINENTILVIEEFNDSIKKMNAKLIDNYGQILTTFEFHGYQQDLESQIFLYFEKHTQNFILFDEQQKQLRIIHQKYPLKTYTIDVNQLTSYQKSSKDEVIITFENFIDNSLNTSFALDTLKNVFRRKE